MFLISSYNLTCSPVLLTYILPRGLLLLHSTAHLTSSTCELPASDSFLESFSRVLWVGFFVLFLLRLFLFKFILFIMYTVSRLHVFLHTKSRASDLLIDGCKPPCSCWELSNLDMDAPTTRACFRGPPAKYSSAHSSSPTSLHWPLPASCYRAGASRLNVTQSSSEPQRSQT